MPAVTDSDVPVEDPMTKYRDMGKIGKGAFGSAHLLVHKDTNKYYVIKKIRLAKQTGWQRSSALQERDMMSTLQHPFIVPHVESWVNQGHTVNVVLGYCERGDLSTLLEKSKSGWIEESRLRKWLCQMLLALEYLQGNKVLHRDIKVSNLLLTAADDVQLSDFGLATYRDAGDSGKREDTNMVGTPQYMSPELLSQQHYSFQTDIWSLGCCFYELSAKKPAFNAFNLSGLVSKIRRGDMPRLPLEAPYSKEWEALLRLMINKDPGDRLTVQQLMARLELRQEVRAARRRALELHPGLLLPPLLPWEGGDDLLHDNQPGAATVAAAGLLGAAGQGSGGEEGHMQHVEKEAGQAPHTPPPAAPGGGQLLGSGSGVLGAQGGSDSVATDGAATEQAQFSAKQPTSRPSSGKQPSAAAAARKMAPDRLQRASLGARASASHGAVSRASTGSTSSIASHRSSRSAAAGSGQLSARRMASAAGGPQQQLLATAGVNRRRTTSDTQAKAAAAPISARHSGVAAAAKEAVRPGSAGGVRPGLSARACATPRSGTGRSSTTSVAAGGSAVQRRASEKPAAALSAAGAAPAAQLPATASANTVVPAGAAGSEVQLRAGAHSTGDVAAAAGCSTAGAACRSSTGAADLGHAGSSGLEEEEEAEGMPVQRLSFGSSQATPEKLKQTAQPQSPSSSRVRSTGGGFGGSPKVSRVRQAAACAPGGILGSNAAQKQQQQQVAGAAHQQWCGLHEQGTQTPEGLDAVTETAAAAAADGAQCSISSTRSDRELQLEAMLQFHAEWAIARCDRAQLGVMAASQGLYRPETLLRIQARLADDSPASELAGCTMKLGERVTIGSQGKTGYIEYIGPLHNSAVPGQVHVGMRMVDNNGTSSGIMDGVPYINVGPGGAIFLPAATLMPAERRASTGGGSSRRSSAAGP